MADVKKKKTMRHASALKAHRQSLDRRDQNFQIRNRVRTLTAKVLNAIKEKNATAAKENFIIAQSAWKKAANKGIFHRNAASRNISKLSSRLAGLSAA
jgi:small subunit ribosomal protein S20